MTQKDANNLFLNHLLIAEGGKSEGKLADARQHLQIMNEMLGGVLYSSIKLWATGKERKERSKK